MSTKYIIRKDTGSVYWEDEGMLWFAPLNVDGTFDISEGNPVDEELVGDGEIVVQGVCMKMQVIFDDVKEKLGIGEGSRFKMDLVKSLNRLFDRAMLYETPDVRTQAELTVCRDDLLKFIEEHIN